MSKTDSNIIEFGQDDKLKKLKYNQTDLVKFEAKNPRQSKFNQYFYDNKTPMILLTGYAGTGKTFTALHAALNLVLDPSTHYEHIVIVRSAIESGASVGFLPGTLSDKNAPYEMPYKAIMKKLFKDGNDAHYENLKSLGMIQYYSTNHLRGLTLYNSIVIVEECQNLDYMELKTTITRCGEGTRILFTGDLDQDDLKRKKKETGMIQFMRVVDNMGHNLYKDIKFQLEDVVRSGLCSGFLVAEYELLNEINRE